MLIWVQWFPTTLHTLHTPPTPHDFLWLYNLHNRIKWKPSNDLLLPPCHLSWVGEKFNAFSLVSSKRMTPQWATLNLCTRNPKGESTLLIYILLESCHHGPIWITLFAPYQLAPRKANINPFAKPGVLERHQCDLSIHKVYFPCRIGCAALTNGEPHFSHLPWD